MKQYKLLEGDGMGYFNLHTGNMSLDEAKEMLTRHQNFFPETDWIIEEDEEEEKRKKRSYNNRAVDGWEDLFNR
jgi:hypothetical protein